MISVIIAAKDSEKWIKKTIDSLLKQTFSNWECIISINGSSDATEEIAKSYDDKRFRVICSNIPNKSAAVNRALITSKYELICILDSDDLWHSNKLETQILMMNSLNIDILGTQMSYINEYDEICGTAPNLPISNQECVSWLMQKNNPIANSSVLYKKSIHDIVGYYDPEKFGIEDYDMWMRAMRSGLRMQNCKEKLLKHRIHASSNYNTSNKQQILKNLIDLTNFFYFNQLKNK